MASIVDLIVGERYFVGTEGIRWTVAYAAPNGGHLETMPYQTEYFGEPITSQKYFFVADKVGFGEVVSQIEGTGLREDILFRITEPGGRCPSSTRRRPPSR